MAVQIAANHPSAIAAEAERDATRLVALWAKVTPSDYKDSSIVIGLQNIVLRLAKELKNHGKG